MGQRLIQSRSRTSFGAICFAYFGTSFDLLSGFPESVLLTCFSPTLIFSGFCGDMRGVCHLSGVCIAVVSKRSKGGKTTKLFEKQKHHLTSDRTVLNIKTATPLLKNITYINMYAGTEFHLKTQFSCSPLRVKKLHLKNWNFVRN